MFKKIESYCTEHTLIAPNTTIVVGLSGGPDSVFLLHFLHSIQKKYNLKLIAAHLNHGWREEAGHDEQLCKELATSLHIPFVSAHASEIHVTRKTSGSQEDLGRQLRRTFFTKIAHEHNADRIALAHHQDDLIETFFIRLLRGAGVTGLASIRAHQDNYIRPLLCVTKKEILTYLEIHALNYCIDKTNEHDTYLRNRIRKYLIPAAMQCDERAPITMVNTINQLQATDDFLETLTKETYAQVTHDNALQLDQFKQLHPFLQKRVVLHWLCAHKVPFTPSETFFNEIIRFLMHGTAYKHTINSWSLQKNKNTAIIHVV